MAFLTSNFTGTHYNLRFDSDGNMYIASKKPLEGYIPYYKKNTGEFVNYRMILKSGISGYLDRVAITSMTTTQGGALPMLNLGFRDYVTDEVFNFSFQIFTTKGGVTNYVKSFVKYYYNIDITKMLRFNSFKRKPGDEYPPQNLAFAYYNEGRAATKDDLIPFYFKNGQNGWPEREKVIDPVKKVEVSDCTKQDAFAYQTLQTICNDFAGRIPGVREQLRAQYKDVEKKGPSAYFPIPDNDEPVAPTSNEMPEDYAARYNAAYGPQGAPQYQQPQPPQQYQGGYQQPYQQPQYQQPAPPPQYQAPQYQQPYQAPAAPQYQAPVQPVAAQPVAQQAPAAPQPMAAHQPMAAQPAPSPVAPPENVRQAPAEDPAQDYDDLPF